MPIYEYQCDQCDHGFDTIQKFSDAPLIICPECDQESLRKKISAPSFRLSGTGWYETDFKSDKEKKRNLAGDRKNTSEKNTDSNNKKSAVEKSNSTSDSQAKNTAKCTSKPASKSTK